MLFGQHDKTEAFFFLQDTDIVSSNLWTGNRVNIRPLQKGKNIMYLGRMAELASSEELFFNPIHPYTQALLSAVPIPNPRMRRERVILQGDLPSPAKPPTGCVFHTRCPLAQDICKHEVPVWTEVKPEHFVACHFSSNAI